MSNLVYETVDGTAISISLGDGESALEGLLRNNIAIPNGCRSGVCQSCLMQTDATSLPNDSQRGLRTTQKQQGLFLSCCLMPDSDIKVRNADHFEKYSAIVLDSSMLNQEILRLRLRADFDYRPGQYITVWKDTLTARSYSIASVADKNSFIELHIRVYPDGAFSSWAADQIVAGDTIECQGPMGSCFYTEGDDTQELLLAGIGTGIAPLYGILQDALAKGHKGNIYFIAGGKDPGQARYLEPQLDELARLHPQLNVVYSAASSTENNDIYALVKMLKPNCTGVKAFVCGAETFVRKLKKQLFLSGANMADINSDPFIQFNG